MLIRRLENWCREDCSDPGRPWAPPGAAPAGSLPLPGSRTAPVTS